MKIPHIAANTLVSYLKSVGVMAFGLFSSRWVLAALGQSDYGLFGLVGSVVAVVTFLQIALSSSIVRFLAVSPEREMGGWMVAAIRLQGTLAIAVAVIGWPLGEYAIVHWLDVPVERLAAGLWVFRATLAATVVSIAAVPWSALFAAKQKFGEPALYDVLRAAAMFVLSGWLLTARGDRLITFAVVTAILGSVHSAVVVYRAHVRFKLSGADWRGSVAGGGMQAQLIRYAACRILGIVGYLIQKQGVAFVVNLSFGVRANAAYAVANHFAVHASSLVTALATALTPALAQATGQNGRGTVNRLTLRACVFSGVLALTLGVPLMLETEGVLRIWLVKPPEGVATLAFAFTAAMVVDAATTSLVAALSAVRNIGRWQTFDCLVLSLTCPVVWGLFRCGCGLSGLGVAVFGVTCVMMIGRLAFARRMIGFSVREWVEAVAVPLVVVGGTAFGAGQAVRGLMEPGLVRMVCVGFSSTAVLGAWVLWMRERRADEPRRVGRMWTRLFASGRSCTDAREPAYPFPCAPLAIFGFKRVDTLERVLASLARCENLTGQGKRVGYAFLDGARTAQDEEGVRRVRAAVEKFRREHFPNLRIVERERNWGNPVNMPAGISEVLDRHGRIIVVEDDVVVSRYFLTYLDEALERYESRKDIWCVQGWRNGLVRVPRGYPRDVYLTPRCLCWGWGTWRDRWSAVDFEMKGWPAFREKPENLARLDEVGVEVKQMLDEQFAGTLRAWDVQCVLHMMERNLWAVEPRLAMTKNIGFGTECDHCQRRNVIQEAAKYYDFRPRLPEAPVPDRAIYGQYRQAMRYWRLKTRLWREIQRIWAQM